MKTEWKNILLLQYTYVFVNINVYEQLLRKDVLSVTTSQNLYNQLKILMRASECIKNLQEKLTIQNQSSFLGVKQE
jgi:hypothetical protein